jgi:hypothetical protein
MLGQGIGEAPACPVELLQNYLHLITRVPYRLSGRYSRVKAQFPFLLW